MVRLAGIDSGVVPCNKSLPYMAVREAKALHVQGFFFAKETA